MKRQQRVLMVDDDSRIAEWMQRLVRPLNVELLTATSGTAALTIAKTSALDVILLDVNLPDMSGYEVCQQLRSEPSLRDLPIIFLTAAEDLDAKVRAFECGASDYVTKPFDIRELRARVRSALRTQALLEELVTQAHTDALTGLPNRKGFHKAVNRQIAAASGDPANTFALIFLDLDRFKNINDSLGHEIGDELLIHVAKTLTNLLGEESTVRSCGASVAGRMGGDEFAILMPQVREAADVESVAASILAALAQPTLLHGYTLRSAASIGVRICSGGGLVLPDLLRDVDVAMYQAKAGGRGRYAVFDQAMHQQVVDRISVENDLRNAAAAGQLELHYQPLVDLQSGRVEAFEALLRWNHPKLGSVSPAFFIPLAEESELIVEIGNWVLAEAARFARRLREKRADHPRVSVNLSKRQLASPDLHQTIHDLLVANGLTPNDLELEITETAIMFDPEVIVPVLAALRNDGIRLAIDDFGTGYSSLSTLPQFPVNTLKIDRSFIRQLGVGKGETAIVNAVVSLSAHLGMRTVAEGIETLDQLFQLQSIGCTTGQGFLFGRPMPASAAMELPSSVQVMLPADQPQKQDRRVEPHRLLSDAA